MVEILQSDALAGLPHGFSGRSAGDVYDVMPRAPVVRLKQVHSADVVTVDGPEPWADADRPEADALVTHATGFLIAIVTADCAPVLLADTQAAVIGAAHAGWRGAYGGVLENTVEAMVALGAKPDRISAAIGPTIARSSYEVDASFKKQFDAAEAGFFSDGAPGHFQFDLPAYVAERLGRAGVTRIDDLGEDTYSQPARFHSFRRATHEGTPTEGRQLSVIGCARPVA